MIGVQTPPLFLPTSRKEARSLGWSELDVILVSGDAYIDSPFIGIALIGKILASHGFRVGIIAQPDCSSADDILRLDEPKLFWGISAGCVDSMVANYTASGRRRKSDDYTPGAVNNRRPDRASIVYANLIRRYCKDGAPLVLGGIEASLRRIAHYDAWDKNKKIRRSILFDARAEYLLYGMADRSVVELAFCLRDGRLPLEVRGLCYIASSPPPEALLLPSYADSAADSKKFVRMFEIFAANNDPVSARMLAQQHETRFLVHTPPPLPLNSDDLDAVHSLPFARDPHPQYQAEGAIRALDTIRFAISTHRGCYGECNFCAIAVHQGRAIQSRSQASIVAEATGFVQHPAFKGIIADLGGPTANMYGFDCRKKQRQGACPDRRCLFPKPCPSLRINQAPLIQLLRALRKIKKIKKIIVASGIRHDLILADKQHGLSYLRELVFHHTSGQMKLAPEHCSDKVLQAMGKPGVDLLSRFRELFIAITKEAGLDQYLTYYLMAAHPDCELNDMVELRAFCLHKLGTLPRQVQIFTPTPSTWSTCMYWTGYNPIQKKACFVERESLKREKQKSVVSAPMIETIAKSGGRSGKKR